MASSARRSSADDGTLQQSDAAAAGVTSPATPAPPVRSSYASNLSHADLVFVESPTKGSSVADEYGHAPKQFSPEAIKALQDYNWTGNIRELANVVERLFILCDQQVTADDIVLYVSPKL